MHDPMRRYAPVMFRATHLASLRVDARAAVVPSSFFCMRPFRAFHAVPLFRLQLAGFEKYLGSRMQPKGSH